MSALPLVLLHGWGTHAGVWADVIARLDLGQAVFAPDISGDGAGDPGTVEQAVDRLAAAAPERCVVAGWSLGGQLALAWAHRHPQQLARLVLIASTPRFTAAADWPHGMAPAVLAGFAAELADDPAALLRRFLMLESQGDAQARAVVRQLDAVLDARPAPGVPALLHMLDWLRDTDLRPLLAAVKQPALVVHGDRDRITPVAAGAYLAGQLQQASFEIIEGAAHAPFISDAQSVARLIEEFCRE